MTGGDEIATLSSVHERLIGALADLDRVGRHTAAAHLGAVLDLIEGDIGARPARAGARQIEDLVVVTASQMTEMFGDRAGGVARRQLADATGPALLAWAAILNRMAS